MSDTKVQTPANDDPKATPTYRALRVIVIILGVLIVLGLGALIAGIAAKMSGRPAVVATGKPFALPAGARIIGMTMADGRLALRISVYDAEEIDIIDTETGQLVSRIAPPPPGVPYR